MGNMINLNHTNSFADSKRQIIINRHLMLSLVDEFTDFTPKIEYIEKFLRYIIV